MTIVEVDASARMQPYAHVLQLFIAVALSVSGQ